VDLHAVKSFNHKRLAHVCNRSMQQTSDSAA
jgi:hypothetical protein